MSAFVSQITPHLCNSKEAWLSIRQQRSKADSFIHHFQKETSLLRTNWPLFSLSRASLPTVLLVKVCVCVCVFCTNCSHSVCVICSFSLSWTLERDRTEDQSVWTADSTLIEESHTVLLETDREVHSLFKTENDRNIKVSLASWLCRSLTCFMWLSSSVCCDWCLKPLYCLCQTKVNSNHLVFAKDWVFFTQKWCNFCLELVNFFILSSYF